MKASKLFKLVGARLFYMYGNGQGQSTLFSQIKTAVENKDEIFNMSGGEQLRDYLPVGEIVKILVDFVLSHPNNGIINACSEKPISIQRLVEQWIENHCCKIKLNLGYYSYPNYEPMTFLGDGKKLNSFL
ncbi:NAD-dependent epimerase/dehydratase family protein [Laspinema olomoucense]|uniref:NAD-dependent epimerase/dehydratase family protein n=1 Tax=Laspinema olomoucense TaxID=3231600 RepID=UPI0021BBB194|nr:NAD-dependent epimerase/dehydratase family protein [Laspinema sp. D3a]MCT7990065.1 NAD-dependent epimerase/dehydratase family protein [Laspinema sp. D3a]